jgi:hypothetical protein
MKNLSRFLVLIVLFSSCKYNYSKEIKSKSKHYEKITFDSISPNLSQYKIYLKPNGREEDFYVVASALFDLKLNVDKVVSIYYRQMVSGQDNEPTHYTIIIKK